MKPELNLLSEEAAALIEALGREITGLGHDGHLVHAALAKPGERCIDQHLTEAASALLRVDPDQANVTGRTFALLQVAANEAGRRASRLRHENGIGVASAAALDPGFVELVTQGAGKPPVKVESRVPIALASNLPQGWQILGTTEAQCRRIGLSAARPGDGWRPPAAKRDADVDKAVAGGLGHRRRLGIVGGREKIEAADAPLPAPVVDGRGALVVEGRGAHPGNRKTPEFAIPGQDLNQFGR